MYLIGKVLSASLQVVIFAAIPFLYYLVRHRRIKGFFNYIGLKRIEDRWVGRTLLISVGAFVLAIIPLIYLSVSGSLESELLATNKFHNQSMNIGYIVEVLIYAIIQTSLSEEILFRGFLTKRLIGKFGYRNGNIIQSAIFGFIHGIVFIQYGLVAIIISITLPMAMGYIFAWSNEVKCEGSILSSWMIHAVSNIISPIVILLMFS